MSFSARGGAAGHQGLPSEYNSIVGAWVLETSRSDTMESYLRCMLVADLAIEAQPEWYVREYYLPLCWNTSSRVVVHPQMKAEHDHESRHVIAINGPKFVIHKRTKINHFTEIYELNKEKVTQGRSGAKRCTVTLRDEGRLDGIVITTTMPTVQGQMHLIETRRLLDKGKSHSQELHLSNLTTGGRSVTRRIWVRVPVTPVDQESIQEEMSLQP